MKFIMFRFCLNSFKEVLIQLCNHFGECSLRRCAALYREVLLLFRLALLINGMDKIIEIHASIT